MGRGNLSVLAASVPGAQMKAHAVLSIATCTLLALLTSGAALAQDAAIANPTTVRVTLDNPSVRVLESILNPGQKEQVHSHPACVIYVVSGGKVRSHTADGKSVDSKLVTGATIYREPTTHWTENIGISPIHVIVMELKDRK
jgi:quercetin dioxygenase-like cupin family protein